MRDDDFTTTFATREEARAHGLAQQRGGIPYPFELVQHANGRWEVRVQYREPPGC